ncbi:menaquinone-dependent protoporphyrinogen IX dehydrogenase [Persicimonas caeni]|uniref:Menaquinone-dependent protoporphyrinogen IX dehydrogenase n=1 Tax=Persicimonas caeni TaxID=2292766 RepID=A0A4Y6PU09_PERCE|nr:menaquinone-dependent protoporphyrinogen IX dehydrogenase [Persicimonas caeni]QDG51788.1 menaquinone-dependent protoporphyrinogen IX dehydrogenase [Persicimonas caeni]QED33009.1 menaquinone-dependent protoporphyrinogen IX dehydrogenase [Persicimonas caeni]
MNHRIAIIYGTTEGHTRKICEHIAQTLRDHDDQVEIVLGSEFDDAFELSDFDGVIVGGSLHAGTHQRYIRAFVDEHLEELQSMPSAFFSVSLSAASEDTRDDAQGALDTFLEETGWTPEQAEIVAGALKYTEYNWFKRFAMKKISASSGGDTDTSQDYEYTDWEQLSRFAEAFHERLG